MSDQHLENGEFEILVELDDNGGFYNISTEGEERLGKLSIKAFNQAMQTVENVAMRTYQTIQELRQTEAGPDSVEVEFSIKLTGGANAIIAHTTTEGQITVRMSWQGKK